MSGRRRPVSSRPERPLAALDDARRRACIRSPGSVNEKRYVWSMPKNGETCMQLAVLVHPPRRRRCDPVLGGQQVGVALAEGVADLGHDRGQRAVGAA